jgi:hypothetical protein
MLLSLVFSVGFSLLFASQALSNSMSKHARVKARHEHIARNLQAGSAAPPPPYFVVHSDAPTGSSAPPDPSLLKVFLFTFGVKSIFDNIFDNTTTQGYNV